MNQLKIGTGTLSDLDELIQGRKHVIIVDEKLLGYFSRDVISFKANEDTKTLRSIEYLTEELQKHGIDRHSVIIAIGGGITTDVVGFLASIYMRGLPWIVVPTTLMAMADCSIGGKTAVNFQKTKNILGSFHPPESVLIDISFLDSLSETDFLSGMAEIIKSALILDEKFVKFLEKNRGPILRRNPEILIKTIKWAIKIKMSIVEEDLTERNLRKLLNFGHTYGHALETATDYKIPHGHAVALGILLMLEYAEEKYQTAHGILSRTKKLFNLYGLPTQIPIEQSHRSLRKIALTDKKRIGNSIDLVILPEIGKAKIVRDDQFLIC